jgi:hypothetical protein
MKPLKSQRGFADIILIAVVAVLILGFGGYVYYRQQQANKTYNAAGSGATVTKHAVKKVTTAGDASSSEAAPTSTNSKLPADVLAAAVKYCQTTQHTTTYFNGSFGSDASIASVLNYSTDKKFATTNGACINDGQSPSGRMTEFYFDDLAAGWTVIFTGQQAPACDDVKNLVQYNIPSDFLSCYNADSQLQAIR